MLSTDSAIVKNSGRAEGHIFCGDAGNGQQ